MAEFHVGELIELITELEEMIEEMDEALKKNDLVQTEQIALELFGLVKWFY